MMKKQLFQALLAVFFAVPCAAGAYSAAELKKLFMQSVQTDDMDQRVKIRMKIYESSPRSAYGLASQAFLLHMSGRISPKDEAQLYTKALELDPSIAVAHYNRARLYEGLGKRAEALEGYKKAIELGYKKTAAYLGLADGYRATKQNALAFENYAKVLAMEPGHAFAHNNRGAMYLAMKEYDKAIADFSAALKTSTFAMAYMNRGDAYAGKKDYQKALGDYKKAEALIPDSPDVFIRRGRIYYGIKEYQKAIAEFETAAGMDPGNTTNLNYLGMACYLSGDYDRAESAFKRSSAAEPEGLFAYERLAGVYTAKKLPDLAAEALKKAISLAPQRADLKEKLASVYAPAGGKKTGGPELVSSPAAREKDYFSSGERRLAAGEYKGAEADFKQALKKRPDYPEAIVGLSLAFLRTGRKSEGLELFSSAVDTDPKLKKTLKDAASGKNGGAASENKAGMLREMFRLYESFKE
ncbi:MAG: tetratricopeptide repeat protein [Elusimicrobiota bacterium]|nr:tetratricopeptide repeat protein [Elusimicrobiota bacterium]